MKTIRQLHLYLGLFFAPSIIFFAFTGALQTFSLHENKHPGDHHPQWIATLASVHKDQELPVKRPPKAQAPAKKKANEEPAKKEMSQEKAVEDPGADEHNADAQPAAKSAAESGSVAGAPPPKRKSTLPLKTFVGFLGIGLIFSSLLGIYMAFKYNRDRRI